MRICLVSHEYPPETARGGIGSQTLVKATGLAARGHEVHVLSRSADPGPDLRTEVEDGVAVHRMNPPGLDVPLYAAPAYWLAYSWSVLRHLDALQKGALFDVVDFPDYGGEGFAYLLDRAAWGRGPVALQLHAPLAMFAERIGWPERGSDELVVGSFQEGFAITHADGLMACSDNIARFVSGAYGVPLGEVATVHCGVDTTTFHPPAEGAPSPRPTVLFVGNIARNKGIITLVEAVLRLRSRHPGILLRAIGQGDDDLGRQLMNRASANGASDAVSFAAFVPDRTALAEEYRQAAVFASPAEHEFGVANVYLEAMASGCPVVACDSGAAPEAVEHGRTGFLIPFDDVEATVTALDRLLSNDALRRRMGAEGRRRVEERFAVEPYLDRVFEVYERAIATFALRHPTAPADEEPAKAW